LLAGGLYYRSHQAKPLAEKDKIFLADFRGAVFPGYTSPSVISVIPLMQDCRVTASL
jgi:hypothetical protein